MALSAGTRLGLYEIVSPLGAGGMGEVYRARDTKLGRDVAVKTLPETLIRNPERVSRFHREAQVLASLNHPHIAAIYGFEEANGTEFLVLELVDGESLDARLARGPIPADEALGIARQIGDALSAAHEKGIIHRDLKPANIAFTADGNVKVLDFGLAKALESTTGTSGEIANSPTITSPALMTAAGLILGTAAYMSPEQAKGRDADKRSDVWAFGCVLYEMLTGTRAFGGEDVADTLAAVLRADPDWRALPPEVSPALRTILMRCLEKDRKKRIADISVALFVIDEPAIAATAVDDATLSPVSSTRAWRRALPLLGVAVVAGVLVGGVMRYFTPFSNPPAVTRFAVLLADGQDFTNDGRQLVAISPDGTQMVYVANFGLHLRSMSDSVSRPIAGTTAPGGVLSPVFSPDGQSIAYWSTADQAIKRIATTGGAPVPVTPAERPLGMTWDDAGILFGQRGGIMRVAASGGATPTTLVKVDAGEVADAPQMLPDGRTVLFTLGTASGTDRWDKAKVVAQSGSNERKILIDGGSDGRYLPTGHLVYAFRGTLFAVPFDAGRLEKTGVAVPIIEGVRRATTPDVNTGVAHYSVSRTGSLMYVPGPVSPLANQRNLARLDRKGNAEPLPLPPGPFEFPRISPDGTRLAFGTDDGREADIWIYDLSGASQPRRLTFGGRNRFPIWSADGQRVAFQSNREGDLGIFVQRADVSGTAERLTRPEPGTSHFPESWSPTTDAFLFSASSGNTSSLWLYSLRDRKAEPFGDVRLTSPSLARAVFSPDGGWVAYSSDETRGMAVYLQPFPATGRKDQISAGHSPVWSQDGKEIFLVGAGGAAGRLVAISLTTSPTVRIGNPVPVSSGGLEMSPGLLIPRRFDIGSDRAIIGVIASQQAVSEAPAVPRIEVVLNWFEELKARAPAN